MIPEAADFKDPFNAGQLVGVLTALMFVESNNGIPEELLQNVKQTSAGILEEYFEKPSEDILLMIETALKEAQKK